MNKEYDMSNVSNTINGYLVQQDTVVLDKYYHTEEKQIPQNAQRDILTILNNGTYKTEVSYLTIEVEGEGAPQTQLICHVVIKTIGYNHWNWPSTVLYNEYVQPGPTTIEPLAPQEGFYVTCDGINDISSNKSNLNN